MSGWLSRWVSRAIAQLVPLHTLDAALGDLAEEYALRAQSTSAFAVARWYWGQIARSMPQMMWIDIRRQGWAATFAVALGGWLIASIVELVADGALVAWAGSAAAVNGVAGALIGLTALALGGYIAALVRPAATKVMAAITALFVGVLMLADVGDVPRWYGVAFLVFGPLMSIAGGAWRKTRS
jgi:hypothetical protein